MTKALLPIQQIAAKLNLPEAYFEALGPATGKIKLELLGDPAFKSRGKLILVTATTPTISGEGKTVTSIGLTQGLEYIGKKSIITSREPSLGPVFGMKGGAAGGGMSQLEPSQKINLHFNGDFHAITSAHNLLAALLDAHLFHGNDLQLDPGGITWPRSMDMNDRALRRVIVEVGGKRAGANRQTGFVITAASEIMAILALAGSREDLRKRLDAIIVGTTREGRPVRAKELEATGGMMALLTEAIQPNLVQTTEGTPATVHTGPFANIAHGTSSILSQQIAMRLADYVVNECGFAADLGAEKYFDIVMPTSGIRPSVAVLVTTAQSLRTQGEGDLERGFANLGKHIDSLKRFGVPIVAGINRFPKDTPAELDRLLGYCKEHGVTSALNEAFTKGGAGAAELAERVVETIAANPQANPQPIYAPEDSFEEKVSKVVTNVYGGAGASFGEQARAKLRQFAEWGYGKLPVCIAKTQYSLSDDAKKMGAPRGWTLNVTNAALSSGAGFVVVISGNMMLMPGLPKVSRAASIEVDASGEIAGV
jgi:formate--tetrahydrofolate ligase